MLLRLEKRIEVPETALYEIVGWHFCESTVKRQGQLNSRPFSIYRNWEKCVRLMSNRIMYILSQFSTDNHADFHDAQPSCILISIPWSQPFTTTTSPQWYKLKMMLNMHYIMCFLMFGFISCHFPSAMSPTNIFRKYQFLTPFPRKFAYILLSLSTMGEDGHRGA